MHWARHCLRVRDSAELADFYGRILGMTDHGTAEQPAWGYDPAQCLLALRQEPALAPYAPSPRDLYWKIGITLRDLDHAVAFLRREGWPVSEPRQFRDIGYLCHLRDPEGFAIELLQQGFEGQARPAGGGHAIGAQATLAHITFRITDLAAARALFEARLGLRLLSVQPVPERGFTLYFYAWSDETLPDPDLEAVANRSWLWARPYALLELQHWDSGPAMIAPDPAGAGFAGLAYGPAGGELTVLDLDDLTASLR